MAGMMDELNKALEKVRDGAKSILDRTDIDEKLIGAARDVKDRAQALLDKTDIDDKIVGAAKDLKDRAQALFEQTDIDEKVIGAAKGLKDKAQQVFDKARPGVEDALGKAAEMVQNLHPKDAMDDIKQGVSEQVEKIRAASKESNPIHDYIQQKYHGEEQ